MTRFLSLVHLSALLALMAFPALAQAQGTRSLTGLAHNVTVGVKGGVTLNLIRQPDATYSLTGIFNGNLAGDVTATGRAPTFDDGTIACAEGHECLLFDGQIALDSRAGFANGTVTMFVLSLDMDAETSIATGVYHIGLLPGFAFEQYGILSLSLPIS